MRSPYIDGLVQDYSNSSALAIDIEVIFLFVAQERADTK